uniref:Adenosine kinase n=1 Tax=Strigamia maritima TaxID=126957 RepID=T1ITF3_STRMM
MHFRETSSRADSDVMPPPMMDLYIETLTGTAFEVRVSPFETILSVKSKIQRMEGIPASQQHLIWQSKELENENCLRDYCITDGSTLKLVLAMRGGPINTRRIPIEDPTWREMMEYMEANREEIWEKLPGGRQVTLLVFRDGDQINFFRVIDRGDGTLSPLTESISGSSMRALNEEDTEDAAAQERVLENAVTLQKMHALRTKMDALNLKKKPKKLRNPTCNRPTSRPVTNHHVLAVKPKIHSGSFSLNKHTRLPPVAATQTRDLESSSSSLDDLSESSVRSPLPLSKDSEIERGLPKRRQIPGMSYATLEAFRRSMVQLQPNVASTSHAPEIEQSEPVITAITTATGAKPKTVVVPRVNRTVSGKRKVLYAGRRLESLDPSEVQHTLAKIDPRISIGRNPSGGSRGRRERLLSSSVALPSRLELHPMEKLMEVRPNTSPEKWDRSLSDVSVRSSLSSKDLCCDLLSRASRLTSQGRTLVAATSAVDKKKKSEVEEEEEASDDSELEASGGDCKREMELFKSMLSSSKDEANGVRRKLSLEEKKAVAHEISLKATQLLLRLSPSRATKLSSSAHKLPPVNIPKKMDPIPARCQVCKKKIGLATTYTCRCGRNFCATHRYAETHDCTFDYKTEGRRLLEQANPLSVLPSINSCRSSQRGSRYLPIPTSRTDRVMQPQAVKNGVLFALGNPLLDITARPEATFLEKYNLKANDAILAEDKHISMYDEMLEKYPVEYSGGGSVQNACRVFAWVLKVSDAATFVGCIGIDKFGERLQSVVKAAGVNAQYMHHPTESTGKCAVLVTGFNRSLCAYLGAANLFQKNHLEKPEGYHLTVSIESILYVAEHASTNNKVVALNLNAPFLITVFKDNMMKALPYVDIIIGNETEAETFADEHNFGTKNLSEIALQLLKLPKINNNRNRMAIITHGKSPVIVAHEGKLMQFPVPDISEEKIIDTNGAGDGFAGGFLAMYVQGKPLEVCIRCGIYAASEIIQRDGCTLPAEFKFQE